MYLFQVDNTDVAILSNFESNGYNRMDLGVEITQKCQGPLGHLVLFPY